MGITTIKTSMAGIHTPELRLTDILQLQLSTIIQRKVCKLTIWCNLRFPILDFSSSFRDTDGRWSFYMASGLHFRPISQRDALSLQEPNIDLSCLVGNNVCTYVILWDVLPIQTEYGRLERFYVLVGLSRLYIFLLLQLLQSNLIRQTEREQIAHRFCLDIFLLRTKIMSCKFGTLFTRSRKRTRNRKSD